VTGVLVGVIIGLVVLLGFACIQLWYLNSMYVLYRKAYAKAMAGWEQSDVEWKRMIEGWRQHISLVKRVLEAETDKRDNEPV